MNQMRKVQEAGFTDIEYQMERADFASGHLIDVKVALDSLLLKENSKIKEWKLQRNQKEQNLSYH